MRHRQQGMTFVGLLCIMALVGLIVYAVIILVPVYLNYMKIARTMDATATEMKGGDSLDPGSVRRIIDRHWQIEDPSAIDAKAIEITKADDGLVMHVAYDDSVHYLYNISLSVHFDHTVKVR